MLLPRVATEPHRKFPFGTALLVVISLAGFFVAQQTEPQKLASYILMYGEGLQPLQWLTGSFVHLDPVALIGNLFFLTCFGIIVETAVGPWKLISLYLVLAVVCGGLEQTMALDWEGFSLGAATAIGGLLGLTVALEPALRQPSLLLLNLRTYATPLAVYGAAFGAWLVGLFFLSGLIFSSLLFNVMGILVGLLAGVALIKQKLAGGQGRDILAFLAEDRRQLKQQAQREQRRELRSVEKHEKHRQQLIDAAEQFERFLREKNLPAAAALLEKMASIGEGLQPTEAQLSALLRDLHGREQWSASIPLMERYVREFPAQALPVQLKLAQVFILHERKPGSGMAVLQAIAVENLPAAQAKIYRQLEKRAVDLYEEDGVELELDLGKHC